MIQSDLLSRKPLFLFALNTIIHHWGALQWLQVSAYVGDAELEAALKGADLVVIPAGPQQQQQRTGDTC